MCQIVKLMDKISFSQHQFCVTGEITNDSVLLPCYYNNPTTQIYGVMTPYENNVSNKYVRIPPNSVVTTSNGLSYVGSYIKHNNPDFGIGIGDDIVMIPSYGYYVMNGSQREYVNYCATSTEYNDIPICGDMWGDEYYYRQVPDDMLWLWLCIILILVVLLILIMILAYLHSKNRNIKIE